MAKYGTQNFFKSGALCPKLGKLSGNGTGSDWGQVTFTTSLNRQFEFNANKEQNCLSMQISSLTQTLVHFLFLASLYFVGPIQTATLKCSVQPSRGQKERWDHSHCSGPQHRTLVRERQRVSCCPAKQVVPLNNLLYFFNWKFKDYLGYIIKSTVNFLLCFLLVFLTLQ